MNVKIRIEVTTASLLREKIPFKIRMGINQIWAPPLTGSDWLIHSLTARSVSLLDDTDSNEVSSSRADCVSTMHCTNWWKVDKRVQYCTFRQFIINAFRTSSWTQHVKRAGIQTYPTDWCCLTVINMIPPANMIQEDTMGKENEREHREPQSPSYISQQESKVWNTHLMKTSVTANRQRFIVMCSAQFTRPFTLLMLQRPRSVVTCL